MTSGKEAGCFTLTWEIENFSLFLSKGMQDGELTGLRSPVWKVQNDELPRLRSPVWKVQHTEGNQWCWLNACHNGSSIEFSLTQLIHNLQLDRCEMFLFLTCRKVPMKMETSKSCSIEKDAIFFEKGQSFLPNDTLTLCCKMWEKTMKTGESRIHSVLHSVNYNWFHSFYDETYIDKDNFLLNVTMKAIEYGYYSVEVGEVPCVENSISFVHCTLSFNDDHTRVIKKLCNFPFSNWKIIFEQLNHDEDINMSLQAIVALHKNCQYQLPHHFPPQIDKQKNVSGVVSGSSCLLNNDLLLMYREGTLSDATLNTEGKSFSAHRSILTARSSVFRAMFEKEEMNEGRSGVVDIKDVDSETVDRMLVFLYSDSVEGVQWKEASALYYAADKYAIHPLKQKCVNILQAGLSTDNACDALVLADKHTDDQLMKCVVDFISEKDEVISSAEWDTFQNSNPLLAAKIVREIYVKSKKK